MGLAQEAFGEEFELAQIIFGLRLPGNSFPAFTARFAFGEPCPKAVGFGLDDLRRRIVLDGQPLRGGSELCRLLELVAAAQFDRRPAVRLGDPYDVGKGIDTAGLEPVGFNPHNRLCII